MEANDKSYNLPTGYLVGGKYQILSPIGKGGFGKVFSAYDIYTKAQVAVKIEVSEGNFSQLTFESKVYRYLADGLNIPTARLFTIDVHRRALVMELLGPNLEDMFNRCQRRFSLKTVCMLADQMICLLEYIHIRYIIHRDVKPDNFVMGIGKNSNKVYLVDFGLAKQYCISPALPHIKYTNRKLIIGTVRYASINAHLGIEQSRRDDLECLGYVFVYFLKGGLPWQGMIVGGKNRKNEYIGERKLNVSVENLCKGLPIEFQHYLNYCRNLRFDERPDYMYLRQLFRELHRSNKFQFDSIFDWSPITMQPMCGAPMGYDQPPFPNQLDHEKQPDVVRNTLEANVKIVNNNPSHPPNVHNQFIDSKINNKDTPIPLPYVKILTNKKEEAPIPLPYVKILANKKEETPKEVNDPQLFRYNLRSLKKEETRQKPSVQSTNVPKNEIQRPLQGPPR